MKYKLIERTNPQDRTQTKWYASPINEGVDTPDQFNTSKISGLKVVFRASVEFKKALDNVKFEKSE